MSEKWLIVNSSDEMYDKVNHACQNLYYMLYQHSTHIGPLADIGYLG